MKRIWLMVAAAAIGQVLPAPGVAEELRNGWYGPEYQDCAHRDTAGIERCLRERLAVWERRLEEAYRALSASLEGAERRRQLQEAQRLWVAYRDANCRYYGEGPGSISRIEAAECRCAMTESRTRELTQAARP